MKLLYATTIDFPSTRANRLQILQMSREWGKILGDDYILGLRAGKDTLHENFRMIQMGNGLRSFQFAWKFLSFAKSEGVDTIFCREEKMLFFLVVFNAFFFRLPIKFFYEIHHLIYIHKIWNQFLLSQVAGVVSLTEGMKKIIVQETGYTKPILVAPDAVDTDLFSTKVDQSAAREICQLPKDKKIVMYTGSLDEPWKGVDTFYGSSKLVDNSALFVVVGGKEHHVAYFRDHHDLQNNFILLGQKPHSEIPMYLAAADVLVIPNSGKSEISTVSTSPMKLFEYMASGRPIVASDIPSLREILNDKNACLVTPDDPDALARGITETLSDTAGALARAGHAESDVMNYTWSNRAEALVSFFE